MVSPTVRQTLGRSVHLLKAPGLVYQHLGIVGGLGPRVFTVLGCLHARVALSLQKNCRNEIAELN